MFRKTVIMNGNSIKRGFSIDYKSIVSYFSTCFACCFIYKSNVQCVCRDCLDSGSYRCSHYERTLGRVVYHCHRFPILGCRIFIRKKYVQKERLIPALCWSQAFFLRLVVKNAVDFHAYLRFPRAGREPPQRICACGVSRSPLFPQESPICVEINSYGCYLN